MRTVAFGPMVHLPSTDWVGRDVAEFLRYSYDDIHVKLFDNFEAIPDVEVIFIIKLMPPLNWLLNAQKRGVKVLYFPIDYFHHPALFAKERVKLAQFDCILLHNERLRIHLPNDVKNVACVDHYLKYRLPEAVSFQDEGFILWIGHIEYLPPLFKALSKQELPHPLKVLTDLENLPAKVDFLRKKLQEAGIGYSLQESEHEVVLNGVKLEQWSANKQEEYMLSCKAAFDTKNDGFAHNLKPPTKAQKYVFNGIPFAISEHSYGYEYFLNKGLKLATLENHERWLSKDYFDEIKAFKNEYAHTQTLEFVSNQYLCAAESTLNKSTRQQLDHYSRLYLLVKDCLNNAFYIVHRVSEKIKNRVMGREQ